MEKRSFEKNRIVTITYVANEAALALTPSSQCKVAKDARNDAPVSTKPLPITQSPGFEQVATSRIAPADVERAAQLDVRASTFAGGTSSVTRSRWRAPSCLLSATTTFSTSVRVRHPASGSSMVPTTSTWSPTKRFAAVPPGHRDGERPHLHGTARRPVAGIGSASIDGLARRRLTRGGEEAQERDESHWAEESTSNATSRPAASARKCRALPLVRPFVRVRRATSRRAASSQRRGVGTLALHAP